eukprot:scaffold311216_cov18-Prasinocladus_malaysianus.AAC.1
MCHQSHRQAAASQATVLGDGVSLVIRSQTFDHSWPGAATSYVFTYKASDWERNKPVSVAGASGALNRVFCSVALLSCVW